MKPTLIALFVVGFALITLPLVFLSLLPHFYGFEVDPSIRFWIVIGNIVGVLALMFAGVKLRDERIRLRDERKSKQSSSSAQVSTPKRRETLRIAFIEYAT